MRKSWMLLAAPALILGACSTVMEYNRPEPTNLSKFSVGERRLDVISTIGTPKSSVKDGDNSCDLYALYTNGPTGTEKGAVILGEAAADFFTLGLFEVVATPAEAVTKSKAHMVLFCYSPDEKLVTVRDEGKEVPPPKPAGGTVAAAMSPPPATPPPATPPPAPATPPPATSAPSASGS